ncbi:MAG: hypothetical protein ACRDP6_13015 [Actinoallomurus sp.]
MDLEAEQVDVEVASSLLVTDVEGDGVDIDDHDEPSSIILTADISIVRMTGRAVTGSARPLDHEVALP